MNLSSLDNLESIEIGNECFESVQTFKIDGLNRLKSIKIGSNSLSRLKKIKGDRLYYTSILAKSDINKSFHILNCESLESIQIGEYSFSDFGGDFELKNLPQLQSIQIGNIVNSSLNFFSSSITLRGINMILGV